MVAKFCARNAGDMDFSLVGDRSALNPKSVKGHIRLHKSCFTNKLLDEEALENRIARRKETKQKNTWDKRTRHRKSD
jgi:hypothetical protein